MEHEFRNPITDTAAKKIDYHPDMMRNRRTLCKYFSVHLSAQIQFKVKKEPGFFYMEPEHAT